jgi:hypothetical protein
VRARHHARDHALWPPRHPCPPPGSPGGAAYG